jgi:hypothetical protein
MCSFFLVPLLILTYVHIVSLALCYCMIHNIFLQKNLNVYTGRAGEQTGSASATVASGECLCARAFPFQPLRAVNHSPMNVSLLQPLPPAHEIPAAFVLSNRTQGLSTKQVSGYHLNRWFWLIPGPKGGCYCNEGTDY